MRFWDAAAGLAVSGAVWWGGKEIGAALNWSRHLDVRLASLGDGAGIRGMSSLLVNQVFAPGAVNARLA